MNSYTIDWLSCSISPNVSALALHVVLADVWNEHNAIPCKPSNGYRWAVCSPCGVLCQSSDREDMRTSLIMSGQALSNLRSVLPDFDARLIALLRKAPHISRLDIAIDIRTAPIVSSLIDCARQSRMVTTAHNWTVIDGSNGGKTLYVGSRASERMLRVYDKAIEQGQQGACWDRIELEVKGDAATRLARALGSFPMEEVIRSWIGDFCRFDNAAWLALMATPIDHYEASQRKLSNTRDWLLDTIAPIIAKRIQSGDESLLTDLNSVVNFLLNPPKRHTNLTDF